MIVNAFDRLDTANNPEDDGVAFTIWFAGCDKNCPGCHNRQLQDYDNGDKWLVIKICDMITQSNIQYTSVVLLGGEPLDQNPDELSALCRVLWLLGYKVWLYTGYEFDDIDNDLLKHLYTIKTGQYIQELESRNDFLASTNQKIYRQIDKMWVEVMIDEGKFIPKT